MLARVAICFFLILHPSAEAFDLIVAEDGDNVVADQGLKRLLPLEWLPLERAVGLYSNAEAAPISKLLAAARRKIDIEIYEMEDADVLAALTLALNHGVKVRVLKDPQPVAQRCDLFHLGRLKPGCESLKNWLVAFRAAGGEFKAFDRAALCGPADAVKKRPCWQHGKMILVDDTYAAISTGNFNVTSLCDQKFRPQKCNRDYTYITRDPAVVDALKQIYAGDWRSDRGPLDRLVAAGQIPRKLTVSPFARAPLTDFITSAKREVLIQNQYLSDEDLAAKIIAFKKRRPEVHVRLNLSDLCEYGRITETKRYRARLMFQALADSGVEMRMFPKGQRVGHHRGYLHAKAIVVDNERAWIGSVNGSATSMDQNREFGIFFAQPTRVAELARQIRADFDDKRAIRWQKSVMECPTEPRRGLANDQSE